MSQSTMKSTMTDRQAKTKTELECRAIFTLDTVSQLQKDVKKLKSSVLQITDKYTDLKDRSRRKNLCILNILAGEETNCGNFANFDRSW